MRRAAIATAILASALAGCAERRIHITSDPPGAIVALNDVEVGRTPLEVDFTWFGVYDVRLERKGYATVHTSAEAKPELHDQPGFDALRALWPRPARTDIRWHFVLDPLETDPDDLIERALEVRALAPEPPATEEGQAAEDGSR